MGCRHGQEHHLEGPNGPEHVDAFNRVGIVMKGLRMNSGRLFSFSGNRAFATPGGASIASATRRRHGSNIPTEESQAVYDAAWQAVAPFRQDLRK
jgi:hypothetical protein